MTEIQNTINDIIEMKDFDPILNGLGDADPDAAMLSYIQKTRDAIAEKPSMVINHQNPEQLLQMYDYLIAHWHSDKYTALKVLAAKEKELIDKGYISYEQSDMNSDEAFRNGGFFSNLALIYEDELDGLFSKLKDKLKAGKEKRKAKLKNFISKLNKVNPVTLAVRNALRGLIALNFLGIASVLSGSNDKSKQVLAKVQNMYKTMGGKQDKLMKSIQNGAKKKALFNKKMQEKVEKGEFNGLDGLGEPISIGALLVSAGAFFAKIWNWIKQAGISIKQKVAPKEEIVKSETPNNTVKEEKEEINTTFFQTGKQLDINIQTDNTSTDTKKNWKKPVLIGLSVITVGGLAWWGINSQKKSVKTTASKPKTPAKNKSDKLGSIVFH